MFDELRAVILIHRIQYLDKKIVRTKMECMDAHTKSTTDKLDCRADELKVKLDQLKQEYKSITGHDCRVIK